MFERFIEENIERDIKSFETTDSLYKRYLEFCKYYNYKIITRRSFGHQIGKLRLGARYSHENKVARWGVKLKPCPYSL